MQKKYDAILFDFDFTLADSLKGTVHCINNALTKININTYQEKDFTFIMGYTIPDIFKHLTGIENEIILKKFLNHYKPYADEVLAEMTTLNYGAIDVLVYLKNKNYKIGIVSTKHKYRIIDVLNKYEISEMFDIIIGQEDIQNRKPDPEGLRKAIEFLNSKSSIYIGDHIVDAKACKTLGIDFVALLSGTSEKSELEIYSPLHIINSLIEIKEFL